MTTTTHMTTDEIQRIIRHATQTARDVWGNEEATCENVGSTAPPHFVTYDGEKEYGVSSSDGEQWGVVFADDSYPVERYQGMDLEDALEQASEMNRS